MKQQRENTMKQGRKCCETAMKRYYETAPVINNNKTVKVDFIPPIRDYELGLGVLSARRGGGGGGGPV